MSTTTTLTSLPHWDLSTLFPSLDSPELVDAISDLTRQLDELERRTHALEAGAEIDPATVSAAETLIESINTLFEDGMVIRGYISGHTSVDTRDEQANARMSELQMLIARVAMIMSRCTAWFGSLDTDALVATSDVARDHAYALRQAKIESAHLMSQPEEDLAAELSTSGGRAWAKLHGDVSSQIMVEVEIVPGQPETLAMTEVRNLNLNPDRGVRQRAHAAEINAWERWETPLAASLNGVKGQHIALAGHRGWDEVLDESLFQNHVDRETLDAMMGAARDAFPDLHRYFAAKASALGVNQLAWYDIMAPLASGDRTWSWDDAVAFVNEQFGTFSDRMRGLSERAFNEHWIDAEPRPGKVGGAFCMQVRRGESRILANFTPSFDGVSTLAHELGHAYHNLTEANRTMLQSMSTPMTLAETASTFCETILRKAALASAGRDEKVAILESSLQDAAQITIDITSRFLFEQSVFQQRRHRELSADEFKTMMLDAQRATYGDAIEASTLHPYMWAVKPHYYSMDYAYYNYPYMFGMLFGLGLYAQYEQQPDSFRRDYDDLLSSTGMFDAAELAARFGIDIRSKGFWSASLDVVREDVDTFERLVAGR